MKTLHTTLLVTTTIALLGCGQQATQTTETEGANTTATATAQAPALPSEFFLNEAPSNAVSLSEARAKAKAGEEIAFTGYIGGRVEPFTEGRAILLLADTVKAPACTDGCEIAWDACCVPNETIAANSATVQVVDAEGKTLKLGLKGENGLEPGSIITVVGNVREANEGVFIVDAKGVSVNKGTE